MQVNRVDDDIQLMARCCAGDLEAFEQVYARHERQVYRHAFYLVGHHEDADDIKQETFLRAWRALSSFRRQSSLLTWLLRICTNLCHDRLRRRKNRPEIAYEPAVAEKWLASEAEMQNPLRIVDRADTLETLLRVLEAMPFPQRQAIVLHLIEGRDYREMGAILGCAPASAKMRTLRAMHQFKERVISLLEGRDER